VLSHRRSTLIVEDDADIRDLMAAFLELKGYPVLLAADGRAALDRLGRDEPLPGLILLDLMMPGMDGFGFRAAQERDPRLASIPVFVLSANPAAEVQRASLRAAGYLPKPVSTQALLDIVRRFCGSDDGAAGASGTP
jgi:CheY-like chemotaxis protein